MLHQAPSCRPCSLIVFVELLETSRILTTVSQAGRVRIDIPTGRYLTVELTGLAPSREATERITLEDEVLPLTLRHNSVGVDPKQRYEGEERNFWIERN